MIAFPFRHLRPTPAAVLALAIGAVAAGSGLVALARQKAPAGAAKPASAPAAAPAQPVAPADQPKVDDVAVFMRMKLEHSGRVLEGLALEDFDKIQRAGAALALASQASSWQVLQTEEYARQSAEFRRSCESLRTAGRERNIDAAVLAWLEVTMKCVQCHKYVRSAAAQRSADLTYLWHCTLSRGGSPGGPGPGIRPRSGRARRRRPAVRRRGRGPRRSRCGGG